MLKLLTILTNILVSNLLLVNVSGTSTFVTALVNCIRQGGNVSSLEAYIPQCTSKSSSEEIAFSLGCSLLKEFAFKFLTYVNNDVQSVALSKLIITEYCTILESLVNADVYYH